MALNRLCGRFSAAHIQRFFDRWLYRLPNPFTHRDRRAGYTYQLSLLQLEVSRTEVFDRPLHGRQFFEEMIKDHIDLGRPEQMKLVFGRRIQRRCPTPHPHLHARRESQLAGRPPQHQGQTVLEG